MSAFRTCVDFVWGCIQLLGVAIAWPFLCLGIWIWYVLARLGLVNWK